MSKKEAVGFVRRHWWSKGIEEELIRELFVAIFGFEPDDDKDEGADLWALVCAGVADLPAEEI